MELSEKSNDSHVVMHGAIDKDLSYRVIFSGKIAETDEDVFAIYFMIFGLKNTETEQNFNLL